MKKLKNNVIPLRAEMIYPYQMGCNEYCEQIRFDFIFFGSEYSSIIEIKEDWVYIVNVDGPEILLQSAMDAIQTDDVIKYVESHIKAKYKNFKLGKPTDDDTSEDTARIRTEAVADFISYCKSEGIVIWDKLFEDFFDA